MEQLEFVEHLVCDIILEAYILEMRPKKGYLPNLKSVNRINLTETDLGKRTTEKKVIQ